MIVTDVEPAAATVPLVGLPEKFTIPTPGDGLGMLHVNVLFPLLLMVSVAVALVPTCTSPNASSASSPVVLPDSEMMRVGVGAVGEQELVTAPTASSATTNTPDHHRAISVTVVIERSIRPPPPVSRCQPPASPTALDVTHAVPVDEQRVDIDDGDVVQPRLLHEAPGHTAEADDGDLRSY